MLRMTRFAQCGAAGAARPRPPQVPLRHPRRPRRCPASIQLFSSASFSSSSIPQLWEKEGSFSFRGAPDSWKTGRDSKSEMNCVGVASVGSTSKHVTTRIGLLGVRGWLGLVGTPGPWSTDAGAGASTAGEPSADLASGQVNWHTADGALRCPGPHHPPVCRLPAS